MSTAVVDKPAPIEVGPGTLIVFSELYRDAPLVRGTDLSEFVLLFNMEMRMMLYKMEADQMQVAGANNADLFDFDSLPTEVQSKIVSHLDWTDHVFTVPFLSEKLQCTIKGTLVSV